MAYWKKVSWIQSPNSFWQDKLLLTQIGFLLESRAKLLNLSGSPVDSSKILIESKLFFLSIFFRVWTPDPRDFFPGVWRRVGCRWHLYDLLTLNCHNSDSVLLIIISPHFISLRLWTFNPPALLTPNLKSTYRKIVTSSIYKMFSKYFLPPQFFSGRWKRQLNGGRCPFVLNPSTLLPPYP